MLVLDRRSPFIQVAPRAGAWIEIPIPPSNPPKPCESPPVRGRGLKRTMPTIAPLVIAVAPRAGAWIETMLARCPSPMTRSRPPCGGVD